MGSLQPLPSESDAAGPRIVGILGRTNPKSLNPKSLNPKSLNPKSPNPKSLNPVDTSSPLWDVCAPDLSISRLFLSIPSGHAI